MDIINVTTIFVQQILSSGGFGMAGRFKLIDYNKEGPGVYRDQPESGPVKTFFAICGRKFWKIIQINMLFTLLTLPFIALSFLIGAYIFPQLFSFMQFDVLKEFVVSYGASLTGDAAASFNAQETASLLLLQFNIVFGVALVGLQLVVCGPVQAGITYIFRNYSREEHAFIWSDFKDQAKLNWKQSAIASIIGIVGFIIFSINIWFYSSGKIFSNGIVSAVFVALFIAMMVLLAIMQMYVYPMMVTFKLSIRQIYKNAFLLTMAKLPGNIGVLLAVLVFSVVIPLAINTLLGAFGIMVAVLYYFLIGFGFTLLLSNFFVYRQMKKYMIDPMLKKEQEENAALEDRNEERPIFKDVKIGKD